MPVSLNDLIPGLKYTIFSISQNCNHWLTIVILPLKTRFALKTITRNRELYFESEKAKDEKRVFNVIIRGIPESDNEEMYETMDDLFTTMQNSFTYVTQHRRRYPSGGNGNLL